MRLEQLRQFDLNLLVAFAVIAEEKSITGASSRLLLSQPAVSRALQRARLMFKDDLLVRSAEGFELTPRGRKILQELDHILPKIKNLVGTHDFDPKVERSRFRLSAPDNACTVVLPGLSQRFATPPFQASFEFLPWQSDAADLLEHGALDLFIVIDDGLLPSHFQVERLFREEWICIVARASRFRESISLKRYLAANHVAVSTLAGVQSIPDKQIAAQVGTKRRYAIKVPYFGAALSCLPGTDLILTATSGMRTLAEGHSLLRVVKAPKELQGFHFCMVWHPRMNTDTRHMWLRETIRQSLTGR